MKGFIEVTSIDLNLDYQEFLVNININNILCFYDHMIYCVHTDGHCFNVKENKEEIKELIKKAQS